MEAFTHEYKHKKRAIDWQPCTAKDKENLSKKDFHGLFIFREIPKGVPTKNAVVEVEKEAIETKPKKKKKEPKEETDK